MEISATSLQKRFWFNWKAKPQACTDNVTFYFQLQGLLNISQLKEAVDQLIANTPALRMCLQETDDEIFCHIQQKLNGFFDFFDVGQIQSQKLTEKLTEYFIRPFDLVKAPLFRIAVFRISTHNHVLGMCFHHMIMDAQSMHILLDRLSTYYNGSPDAFFDHGEKFDRSYLKHLEASYKLAAKTRQYWQERLRDAELYTKLPKFKQENNAEKFNGQRINFSLSKATSANIFCFVKENESSAFIFFSSIIKILLYKYTHKEDIIIAYANSLRVYESRNEVGAFIDVLPMRCQLNVNKSMVELLGEMTELRKQDHKHRLMPYDKILADSFAINPENNNLVPNIWINSSTYAKHNLLFTDIESTVMQLENFDIQYELALRFDLEEKIFIEVDFDKNLFDSESIQRFQQHFSNLVVHVIEKSDKAIFELEYLSKKEKQFLLFGLNETAKDYPQTKCVHQIFSDITNKCPDATAVISNNIAYSYRYIESRSNHLAYYLQQHSDIVPGQLVCLCLDRSELYLIAMLAIWKIGAAFVPIFPKDPEEVNLTIIRQSNPCTILSNGGYKNNVGIFSNLAAVIFVESVLSTDNFEQLATPIAADPQALAYVIFTSGSTGSPKGVMIQHDGMLNHLFAKINDLEITAKDTLAQIAIQTFDVSIWQFMAPLLVGGTTVVFNPSEAWEPKLLLAKLAVDSVTIIESVPSHLDTILDFLESEAREISLPSLRYFIMNGEPLYPSLCNRWLKFYSDAHLINAYGATECSDDVSHFKLNSVVNEFWKYIPINGTLQNLNIYILDKNKQPVAVGIIGELYVSGVGVGRGYLNDLKKTNTTFSYDPFSTNKRKMYKTGDLVRYSNVRGEIEFIGRADDQIKLRGYRIELGEIEVALKNHPEIDNAIVVYSKVSKKIIAYFVSGNNKEPRINKVRKTLSSQLPSHMIPTSFIRLKSFPLMPNGKIDKNFLMFKENSTEDVDPINDNTNYQNSQLETLLLGIWENILEINELSIKDNLFDLGLHSLLCLKFINQMKKHGFDITIRQLFDFPTIASFANELSYNPVSEYLSVDQFSIGKIEHNQTVPISCWQRNIWFMDNLIVDKAVYNAPVALQLDGDINEQALNRAFYQLVQRHQVLRTSFTSSIENKLTQIIKNNLMKEDVTIKKIDMEHTPLPLREEKIYEAMSGMLYQKFDLSKFPLFRIGLFNISSSEHILFIVFHHIIFDGASTQILCKELSHFYNNNISATNQELPMLPIQYADYSVWLQKHLSSKQTEDSAAFWLKQLEAMPTKLILPTDKKRTEIATYSGEYHLESMSQGLFNSLFDIANHQKTSPFVVLLTAFGILLHRYSGQDHIVIGVPVSMRTHPDLDNLIGLFLNVLPITINFDGNQSFIALLEQVKETVLLAREYQGFPFDRLLDKLVLKRNLSYNPIFQVLFSYQNESDIFPHKSISFSQIKANSLRFPHTISKLDLTLELCPTESGLQAGFEYATDLFDSKSIIQMANGYVQLLRDIIDDPKKRIGELNYISDTILIE